MVVYVCSPLKANKMYTMEQNIENAKRYCKFTAEHEKAIPICPHLYFSEFLNDDDPKDRELGIKMGLKILESCDELWVFGLLVTGGMIKEIMTAAVEHAIPIRWYTEEMELRCTT